MLPDDLDGYKATGFVLFTEGEALVILCVALVVALILDRLA